MKLTRLLSRILVGLLLAVMAQPAASLALRPAPESVGEQVSLLVLYMSGKADAEEMVLGWAEWPPEERYPLRVMAGFSYSLATMFERTSPPAYAYFTGRAHFLDDLADQMGEP